MIPISDLRESHIGARVVYRLEGHGPAEYATIISYSGRRITIRVQGDGKNTEARPNEVSFA